MQLSELFDQINNIPNVPEVVKDLIQQLNNPNADLQAIGAKVAEDPTISLKVLRMVNSAHFGLTNKCSSINDAVVMLGMAKLKTLVIASGLSGCVTEVEGVDLRAFWSDSFKVAGYAKWAAEHIGGDADNAFTAGLIHNIGQLLIWMGAPKAASEIEEYTRSGKERHKVEAQLIGITSAEVGAELASRWKFPDTLIDAIANQYTPATANPFGKEAAAVHLACLINQAAKNETTPEVLESHMPEALMDKLGMRIEASALKEALAVDLGLDQML